jgi:hydroxymethylpyrimidine pyrophosphatase-like HAD family hydrolase
MKLAAVALDYDGTIASGDRLDPTVRLAIGDLRRRGIAVILATGRRLDELKSAAGDLACFDVVVAENGAVLEFPSSGRHVLVGHPPRPELLAELRRRHIPFTLGESVIEADAGQAPAMLAVIRELQQPLILAFNRSRLMVLPQGIAKSIGLRHALHALRLSIHNTIAIGDAENDHDLLDASEVGVAVDWGSAALRVVADEVVEGSGPAAVAEYLQRVARQPRLSAAQMGRRRLLLGHEHDGQPLDLAIRGRTILVAGEPGSGKSWLAGLVCEQLILQGYSLCIIDPEGDYQPLDALPGVITLAGDEAPPHAREFIRALRHPDVSVILDLSRLTHRHKVEYLHTLLPVMLTLRRQTGLPHKILIDEAHYFLGNPGSERLIDPELAGYILVTYRISDLDPKVRSVCDSVVFVTRESNVDESRTLLSLCRPAGSAQIPPEVFGGLQRNEAALLPGAQEAHGRIRRFLMAPRLTEHVRHRAKYLDMPVTDDQAFVFTDNGRPGPRARSLKDFMRHLSVLPADAIAGHMRRRDFSRWLRGVFRDGPLAGRIQAIEGRVGPDEAQELAEEIVQCIRARYDVSGHGSRPSSAAR